MFAQLTPSFGKTFRNCLFGLALLGLSAQSGRALEGQIGVHDPSSVMVSEGKYFVQPKRGGRHHFP
jgi:hypothetical protein